MGCYNYNIFYVSIMVTVKEKPVEDTQKFMIKESKHTLQNSVNHKEDNEKES